MIVIMPAEDADLTPLYESSRATQRYGVNPKTRHGLQERVWLRLPFFIISVRHTAHGMAGRSAGATDACPLSDGHLGAAHYAFGSRERFQL
jgi:hypothetical protein